MSPRLPVMSAAATAPACPPIASAMRRVRPLRAASTRPAGPLLDALDKAGERRNHRSGEDRRFDALGADHRSREPAEQGCQSDQDSEADLAGAGEVGGDAGDAGS